MPVRFPFSEKTFTLWMPTGDNAWLRLLHVPRCGCELFPLFSPFLNKASGLFNALNGLGAGGQVDSETSANANAALYSTFAVMAFFAGQVNYVSPKDRALMFISLDPSTMFLVRN
jgi:hypothetical protein